MNLKDFLANKEKAPDLYWALVIEPGWVQAGIWYIGADTAEVISVSPGAAWETDTELVGAADAALSSSVQKLPEDYPEPSKTVFGVPSGWVKNGEIKEEYLSRIKTICTDLSLTPVGFVVLPEAIAHLYKSEEGSPLSGIVIGLGRAALEITVFKLGNLVGSTEVSRSVSLVEDVSEGLARFEGASPLPSRIIVFDGKEGELDEAKEVLVQASWEEDLPAGRQEKVKFLHTPKVEILDLDKKVIATSLAGAAEIGQVTAVSAKEQPLPLTEGVENVAPPEENIDPGDLGFAVGRDVSQEEPEASKQQFMPQEMKETSPIRELPKKNPPIFHKIKNMFGAISGGLSLKSDAIPRANKLFKKSAVAVPTIFGLLLVAFIAYWWFSPKATVTIFVSPKNFQEDVDISFSTEGKTDLSAGIIPASALTSKISGDKTKATSGTKTVGDKAKGTVQISNGNPSAINLSAGTILTSSGGLKFVTNSEASISGQVLPGSPGTGNMDVTAGDIGAQYNLAKGEVYSVGNFSKSLVAATSQGDFSGGSSQEISAVSKEDQVSLKTDLKNELLVRAADEMRGKVGDNQIFVEELAAGETTSETFDHKVGDEAGNLKLSLVLEATGIAADKEKLLEYARGVLKDKIPGGYVLRDSQINFKFTFVEQKEGLSIYKVTISANFLPAVNADAIIDQISGKTLRVAENYLNSVPGYVNAAVKVKPSFPGFLGTLPRIHKNITIDVASEQ